MAPELASAGELTIRCYRENEGLLESIDGIEVTGLAKVRD